LGFGWWSAPCSPGKWPKRSRCGLPGPGGRGLLGFLVWHGGLSGSVPLKLATDDQFGVMVPTSETLFAAFNLVPVIVLAVTLPFLIRGCSRPVRSG